ncbi:hypothetical protein LCGC14_0368340 [marine sediment metagenome]|uniref:Uncharacterized protein n=1 Tax=marine sediment metagenome TaxID=412755 RepID=A0A0F9TNV8_9ZZZZ
MFDWLRNLLGRHDCPEQIELDRMEEEYEILQHKLLFEEVRHKITEDTIKLESDFQKIKHKIKEDLSLIEINKKEFAFYDDHI